MTNMRNVILTATMIACTAYALAGYFGYATFATNKNVDEIMQKVNILEAPYKGNKFVLAS